jgi:hypothetical protein
LVIGLDVFQDWFKDFSDHYVLIGGTAASITMGQADIEFRATKDLDIVLHIEMLTSEFGIKFWAFIQAGGYQIKARSQTDRPQVYRFQKPSDPSFPEMIELFSRTLNSIKVAPDSHLTPIPFDETASSLSAILLDETYYRFVIDGRQVISNMPAWVAEDRLIPLKALAWMDMTRRKAAGETIDSKKIRKHLNDIVTLAGLLSPERVIDIPEKIANDLRQFITTVRATAVSIVNVDIDLTILRIEQSFNLHTYVELN